MPNISLCYIKLVKIYHNVRMFYAENGWKRSNRNWEAKGRVNLLAKCRKQRSEMKVRGCRPLFTRYLVDLLDSMINGIIRKNCIPEKSDMRIRPPGAPKKRKRRSLPRCANPHARRSLLRELLDEEESKAKDFIDDNCGIFIQVMKKHGLLDVFCMFVRIVVDGIFPMDNIAWLLFLDVVRFL